MALDRHGSSVAGIASWNREGGSNEVPKTRQGGTLLRVPASKAVVGSAQTQRRRCKLQLLLRVATMSRPPKENSTADASSSASPRVMGCCSAAGRAFGGGAPATGSTAGGRRAGGSLLKGSPRQAAGGGAHAAGPLCGAGPSASGESGAPGLQVGSSISCHLGPSGPWGSVPRNSVAPDMAMCESSFLMLARMPSATSCSSARWSLGKSSSAMSVTSAWMPTRNHSSSLVTGSTATLRPRRSNKFRKSSPDFFRFGSTAVNGAPVWLEMRRLARSAGSMSQP
mmetsp:Transcript_36793/g.98538  ORF Transcript_36793/g.98538 Transcript_36793/m.98538 type:complete len:282 (+) Transcript_36793:43-888(+)